MSSPTEKSHFEEFLEKQMKPTRPTPKQLEWANKRFSSRTNPPKT